VEITCDLRAHEIDKWSKVDWTKYNIAIGIGTSLCVQSIITIIIIIIITYGVVKLRRNNIWSRIDVFKRSKGDKFFIFFCLHYYQGRVSWYIYVIFLSCRCSACNEQWLNV